MKRIIIAAVAASLAASPLLAQSPKVKEESAGLLKKAKITPDAAMASALAKVPGGTISSAEIERENGKLIYSFDIKTTGKSGIDEVNVNAMTGDVAPVSHEGAAAEKKEAAVDKAKAAKAKAKKPPTN
jgi:hypothetical protein